MCSVRKKSTTNGFFPCRYTKKPGVQCVTVRLFSIGKSSYYNTKRGYVIANWLFTFFVENKRYVRHLRFSKWAEYLSLAVGRLDQLSFDMLYKTKNCNSCYVNLFIIIFTSFNSSIAPIDCARRALLHGFAWDEDDSMEICIIQKIRRKHLIENLYVRSTSSETFETHDKPQLFTTHESNTHW